MEELSDEVIWNRVLAGESRAFGLVWDRHRDRVYRHLLTSGQQPADAEDLSAVAFLELWRRRASVRFVDGSLLPWLIVTARNVTLNAVRSRRRYARLLASLPPSEHASDPAREIADRDAADQLLNAALSDARPVDGHLLAMTALDGFSIRETAMALGMSESAARTRLSRFRARLREVITRETQVEGGTP